MATIDSMSRIRGAIYAEFLQGFGGPSPSGEWGIELGNPTRYSKSGTVYRQDFERGVTLANIGDAPVRVELGRSYRDLDGVLRTAVDLPPHAADALVREPARLRGVPRQDPHSVSSAAPRSAT